jgi:hypothetical protein
MVGLYFFRRKMDKQENMYKCEVCGATFKDPDALVKHRLVHSGADEGQKDELEQGTEQPTQTPTLPPTGPMPIRPATGPN